MMYEMDGVDEVALPFLYVQDIKKINGKALISFIENAIRPMFDARVYSVSVHKTDGYFCIVFRHRATGAHLMTIDVVLSDDCKYEHAPEPPPYPGIATLPQDMVLFTEYGLSVRKAYAALSQYLSTKHGTSGLLVSVEKYPDLLLHRTTFEPLSGRELIVAIPYLNKEKDRPYPWYLDFLRTLNVFKSKRFKN